MRARGSIKSYARYVAQIPVVAFSTLTHLAGYAPWSPVESVPLRSLDALHMALAFSRAATRVITFDARTANAAALHG